ELTAFADTIEWFEPPDTAIARRQPHRVRGAWIDGDDLVVDFVGGRWPNLGPLALRVSRDGADGALTRLTVVMPTRAGDLPVLEGSGGAGPSHARLWRVADHWRVAVPLAPMAPALRTYVKVERPAELACGFFDESGWWPVAGGRERDDRVR